MKENKPNILGLILLGYKWFNPLYYAMLIIAPIIVFFIEGAKHYWASLISLIGAKLD